MSKKLLVTIDGGGALITGPALFFDLLEDGIGSINTRVSAWAGTSAGGLYALVRAKGHEAKEARTLIDTGNPKIFHTVPLWWKLDPTRPKWQEDGLEKMLLDIFGDMKCSDIHVPFFVTSFDFITGKPKVWDNTDTALVRDVARMTSSAPTYFSITPSRQADGGLIANNPSCIGIAGCKKKLGFNTEDILCLSMDTGGAFWKRPSLSPRTTLLGWIKPLIKASLYGNEEMSEFIADAWLEDRHLRVSPKDTKDFELDELASLPEFRKLWQAAYAENGDAVRTFLDRLY